MQSRESKKKGSASLFIFREKEDLTHCINHSKILCDRGMLPVLFCFRDPFPIIFAAMAAVRSAISTKELQLNLQ